MNQTATEATPQAELDSSPAPEEGAPGAVKKGGLIVAGLILGSLLWYLLADRYTPFTDQARVQGYVVGVAPQVGGVVTEVWVSNNKAVEEGERLFRIDPSQYEIAVAKARSDLENTVRQVEAGEAAVASARANLQASQANLVKAQKDTSRLTRLREQDPGTISTRRLEVSSATLDQAKAGVTAAEADIKRAIEQKGGDNDEDNSLIKAAVAALDKAKLDLERTVVKASSRGVITDLRADTGLYAGPGTPVLTLVAVQQVWVRAEFTENNLGHVAVGTPVELLFDSLPGQVFSGKVSSIGLGVSATQATQPGTLPTIDNNRDWLRQSQRFPVNIDFDTSQSEEFITQLRIGGQATAVAYSDDSFILKWIGKLFIRIQSILTYAY